MISTNNATNTSAEGSPPEGQPQVHSRAEAALLRLPTVIGSSRFQRHTVTRYVLAICAIAFSTLSTNFLANLVIQRQKAVARTVDLGRNQTTLSQRIALDSLQLSLAESSHNPTAVATDRSELIQAISTMRETHHALTQGSHALKIEPPTNPSIHRIYFAAPYFLDRAMAGFLAHAQRIATAPPATKRSSADRAADVDAVQAAAKGPLLAALNAAISAYQVQGDRAVSTLHRILVIITSLMMAVLLIEAAFVYRPLLRALGESQAALLVAANTDPLTGCFNRRCFMREANREFDRSRRYKIPLTIMMLDIDHFKRVNDRYGHLTGDQALITVVDVILRAVRSSDLLARIGGEEFAALMPQTSLESAPLVANRILNLVAAQPIQFSKSSFSVTVSIGLADLHPNDSCFEQLLARADTALYAAKAEGRNRIVLAPSPAEHPS